MIEVVNDEQNKPCTFSAEDALKDIELFPRILRSSYGAYYLYEKVDWDAAADSWYVIALFEIGFQRPLDGQLRVYGFLNALPANLC